MEGDTCRTERCRAKHKGRSTQREENTRFEKGPEPRPGPHLRGPAGEPLNSRPWACVTRKRRRRRARRPLARQKGPSPPRPRGQAQAGTWASRAPCGAGGKAGRRGHPGDPLEGDADKPEPPPTLRPSARAPWDLPAGAESPRPRSCSRMSTRLCPEPPKLGSGQGALGRGG